MLRNGSITSRATLAGIASGVLAINLFISIPVHAATTYELRFTGGEFHGPGLMPDTKMPNGVMKVIEIHENLRGVTPYFNNGIEHPNIASSGGLSSPAGKMSDGSPYNEYMDGGIVDVGDGALSLVNLVPLNGPHGGRQLYSLAEDCTWLISTDLALDPGFGPGILITNNIKITSGSVRVQKSIQAQSGLPGATLRAGSVPAGAYLVGRLGDSDLDGMLDGLVVGESIIPIDHIFYPGAAVAQTRYFETNIPINGLDAAGLELIGLAHYKEIFAPTSYLARDAVADFYTQHINGYLADIDARLKNTFSLLVALDRNDLSFIIEAHRKLERFFVDLRTTISTNPVGFSDSAYAVANERFFIQLAEVGELLRNKISHKCGK